MDLMTFQATCSVCEEEYTAKRKRAPGYCGSTCQQTDGRRKRLKLEIYKEFHGIKYQYLTDPNTGEKVTCTTVKLTPRGWELLGRYCAKTGQTAEEWVGEQVKESLNEVLAPEGQEVGETWIVYPEDGRQ